ncbi:hypothetical protein QFC24_005328 [Naganishia onofrii]|uniref:Uncharacterized protein n=1 Tax=Naganishia onofrii TaxID=1851511 RepID=A0ACC2XAP5_9TREE|nr:hypothetical protein QFC24_005328 [Naganishia onofrii]
MSNNRVIGRVIDVGQRDAPSNPDPIMTTDGAEEYEVDRIIAHRVHKKNGFTYLVCWKGYAEHNATWEPAANLRNAQAAMQTYMRSAVAHDDRTAGGR